MQKIWNAESQQYAYAINEKMMREKVMRKKAGASKKVSRIEIFLMLVNASAGSFILGKNLLVNIHNPYLYGLTGILYLATLVIFWQRQKRLKEDNNYERNMLGDINHAIKNATYQERLSLLALGYAMPVFGLVWFSAYEDQKSMAFLIGIAAFFLITIALSVMEYYMIHRRHRQRLEAMRQLLTSE